MTAIAIDCVLDAHAEIGEGAVWSAREQVLYWVDISAGLLHRFDPADGSDQSWPMGEPLGCLALTTRASLVLALASGFVEFDPATGHRQPLGGPDLGATGHRFNDGATDPAGRFLAGSMRQTGHETSATGTLYALAGDLAVSKVLTGFHIINGLAFSPDGATAYVSDSYAPIRAIWAFDHDIDDGAWTNRRLFFDTGSRPGRPDGAAIDADGCYWMAGIGGWELVRLTPAGKVDMVIPFPVEKPTRIAFGGPGLDTMFVTSLGAAISPGAPQPQAGGLFALRVPGVTGLEPWPMTLLGRPALDPRD